MLPKLPLNQALLENESGKYLIINTKDCISYNLMMDGYFERYPATFLEKLFDDKAVCIDVGANMGTFTVRAANTCSAGKVYAYEAQRIVYMQMCGNAILNRLSNVYPNNWAIGNPASGNETIQVPMIDYDKDCNFGAVSLIKDVMSSYNDKNFVFDRIKTENYESVPLVSLDMIHKDEKIDFIKIDVEGMEYDVLEGAKELIAACNPVIYFELLNFSNQNKNPAHWFADKPYVVHIFGADAIAFPDSGIRTNRKIIIDGNKPGVA